MKNGRGELFAEGLEREYDIPYLPDGNPRHTLDVIYPAGKRGEKLPVIIEIHGGGYIACEKNINRLHCRAYAREGFYVVNTDYTLIPEGDFSTMLRELELSLRWVADNAQEYGFDTQRVFISGDSAGGHLVLLLCLLQENANLRSFFGLERDCPLKIRAAAATCPAFTFEYKTAAPDNKLNFLKNLCFPKGADRALLDALDVPKLLGKSAFPPLIVVTTPGDDLLYEQDLELEKALAASGGEYRFAVFESRGNKLGHVFNVLFPEWSESAEANGEIIKFFREQG